MSRTRCLNLTSRNLADTQQRGSLDLPDFIIGMFLIQTCMANPNVQLPATLPPGMYEQASGGRAPPNIPSSPLARQNTGPQSPVRPQYTGGTIQPQRTGQGSQLQAQNTPPRQMSNLPSGQGGSGFTSSTMGSAFSQRGGQQWDVTSDAKATSDKFFAQLDQRNRGTIEGDVAVPFMLQSQLDEGTLATIWDLSDIRHEGKLDRDMFAVAMHLINNKLAGKDLPASLPNSLVPPSLRQEFGGGQQEVLDNGPSNATKDLFDLFSDDPAPPAAQQATSSAFGQNQNQPFSAGGFSAQPLQAQGTGQGVPSRQLSPAPTGNRFVPQSSFGLAATNTSKLII
jgi:epidermal growth factor receptor substrate 15